MLLKLILRQSSITFSGLQVNKCLIWFQYKLLYNLLPTGRYLFQRQLVESPVCVFCKDAEETFLHVFWDCPEIQDYWFDVQGWLHTSFTHCTDIIFSKELVILGSKVNVVTDRILDLCILIAKSTFLLQSCMVPSHT